MSIWKPNETDVRAYPGPSNSWLRSSAELKVNLNELNKSRIKVVKSESGSRVRFDQTDLTDKVSLNLALNWQPWFNLIIWQVFLVNNYFRWNLVFFQPLEKMTDMQRRLEAFEAFDGCRRGAGEEVVKFLARWEVSWSMCIQTGQSSRNTTTPVNQNHQSMHFYQLPQFT